MVDFMFMIPMLDCETSLLLPAYYSGSAFGDGIGTRFRNQLVTLLVHYLELQFQGTGAVSHHAFDAVMR